MIKNERTILILPILAYPEEKLLLAEEKMNKKWETLFQKAKNERAGELFGGFPFNKRFSYPA